MATSSLSSVAVSAVRVGGAVARGGGSSSVSTVSGVHFSGSRRADQQRAVVCVGNRGRASRGAVTLVGTGKFSFGGDWKANGTTESVAKRTSELNAAVLDDAVVGKIEPAILLTEKATMHLKKLKAENEALCLRIGVRQGGCSGMSYIMDFEDQSKLRADDSVIEADGIKMVCDPKSLLFLFGMQLDYSDALIGGGFSFNNPNATSSCGCGKSFAA